MALVQYKVEYGNTYATATNVATDVQSVNISFGRQRPLDQYNANTASIVIRYPNGYASPNSYWITGTWIKISVRWGTTDAYSQIFTGKIADANIDYGIPYVSSVGNADYVTLTCEGNFARLGRIQGGGYAMAADILNTQANNAGTQTGTTIGVESGYGSNQPFPATTVNGTWGDWVNRVALTLNGRMRDEGENVTIANAYFKLPATFGNFSDVSSDPNTFTYEQIKFASYADNYYTQVTVTPESYSAATVQTGSTPYRTYQVNTLNNSTSQATDYANYLLSTYGTKSMRIESVTCNLNAQAGTLPFYGVGAVGTQLSVKFRGTTYQCVLEGGTWSGTPGQASATFYLSAQDLNNYLILDDAIYGKLDNNKLGY
jgi:hypothetical protein